MKKHLSMILALLILFALPVSAFAALEQVGGVYQISTSEDLGLFRNMVNNGSGDLSAKLTASIDLNGAPWTPIGLHVIEGNTYTDYSYRGTFDGNGFAIQNLTVTFDGLVAVKVGTTVYRAAALFGVLSKDAHISDLSIEGVSIDVPYSANYYVYAGAVAGVVLSGDIQDCTVAGGMITGERAGGVAGMNRGVIQNCTIQTCTVTGGTTTGVDYCTGGVAGTNRGVIQNCTVTGGTITGVAAGGVAGENGGDIQNCTVTGGTITGDWTAGGVAGYNGGDIQSCTVQSADINAGSTTEIDAGGVAGTNWGRIQNCTVSGGTITGERAGGVAGWNRGDIQTCTVTGGTINGYFTGGVAGYNDGTILNCTVSGGTITGYNAGGVAGWNRGDIQTCTVTGGTINGYFTGGVAGGNDGGDIQNCTVTGGTIGSDGDAGGVAGYNSGDIQNCTVTGGTITGYHTGGVAGWNAGNIQTCTVTGGKITGALAGGVAGHMNSRSANVQNCAVFGVSISAEEAAGAFSGAIVGMAAFGNIRNSVAMDDEKTRVSASADVATKAFAGGALGWIHTTNASITYTYYPAGIVNTDGIFSSLPDQGGEGAEWAIGNVSPDEMGNYTEVTSYDEDQPLEDLQSITAVIKQGIAVTIEKGKRYELDLTPLPGTMDVKTCEWTLEEGEGIVSIDANDLIVSVTGLELGTATVQCVVKGLRGQDEDNPPLTLTCRVTVVEATTPTGRSSSSHCNSGVGAAFFALAGLFLVGKKKR